MIIQFLKKVKKALSRPCHLDDEYDLKDIKLAFDDIMIELNDRKCSYLEMDERVRHIENHLIKPEYYMATLFTILSSIEKKLDNFKVSKER